jgi:hypothetical protein
MITSLTNDQLRLSLGICRSAGSFQVRLLDKLLNEKFLPLR